MSSAQSFKEHKGYGPFFTFIQQRVLWRTPLTFPQRIFEWISYVFSPKLQPVKMATANGARPSLHPNSERHNFERSLRAVRINFYSLAREIHTRIERALDTHYPLIAITGAPVELSRDLSPTPTHLRAILEFRYFSHQAPNIYRGETETIISMCRLIPNYVRTFRISSTELVVVRFGGW